MEELQKCPYCDGVRRLRNGKRCPACEGFGQVGEVGLLRSRLFKAQDKQRKPGDKPPNFDEPCYF
jgi:RecJ-like exonuclease